ncbi:hypothetical protein GIB67_010077 [Kingdonia uniflora]|uniref:Uncharacterized protein n=1 Tax=Kingdonia uniflora TaxID=39325 RepID=A0A7J7PAT0_9MAGN|nr:hypothetical protein GIB67_010077 [Kingdonia uniflora]
MEQNDDSSINISSLFSIRDYVVAARENNICNNWPFPEEYLEVCVKYCINRVLPPFETRDSLVRNPSRKQDECTNYSEESQDKFTSVSDSCLEDYDEKEIDSVGGDASTEEAVCKISEPMCLLSLSTNKYEHAEGSGLNSETSLQSLNLDHVKRLSHKRKKRKGKCKKRSMVDIIAKAKPCSMEDVEKKCEMNSQMYNE